MLTLNGKKLLVFTDLHTGIKSNSLLRLDITEGVIDEIVKHIQSNSIQEVIFAGDWHNERPSIGVETMCRSIRMINKITEHAKMYFILGNHDIATNNSTEINSVKFLQDNPKVTLITKPTEVMIGTNKTLLCPWLSDLSVYEPESFSCMIGHFDISHKYLIEAYAEEHKSEGISKAEVTNLMIKSGYDLSDTSIENDKTITTKKVNSKKHIGKFVELCKKDGFVYSGHIHNRRSFRLKGRQFCFLGSPLQLTWGDYNKDGDSSNRGFYILDRDTLRTKFIENKVSPVHRKFFISQLPLNDKPFTEIFKRDYIHGQFVRIILDKQFDFGTLNEIISIINEHGPIEPAVVDYDFSISFESNTEDTLDGNSLISSKLNYIKEYIEGLSDEIFKDFSVNKSVILEYVEQYFNITEDQM